jgi:hypothetical protein
VRHLNDGALRRLYDEPLALEEKTRAHYNDCAECQSRFSAVAEDARHAYALMAVPGATVDAEAALRRVKNAAPTAASSAPRLRLPSVRGWGWRKPAAAVLVAAALSASLAFTSLAQTIQSVFEPTQVQTVNINQSDLQGLDVFKNWGDVQQGGNTSLKEAGSAQEAAQQAGLPELKPGNIPDKFSTAPVSYGSVGQFSGNVTFNNNAPEKLHGATLTVQAGPGQAIVYGDVNKAMTAGKQATSPQEAASAVGPMLAVVEMHGAKVTSSGASVADIKSALTGQPGLGQPVKDAINSIDDPKGNVPIIIPTDYAHSEQGTLGSDNKQAATFVGDNTGLGAGVIWVNKDTHVVYAVVGIGVDQTQVKAVANSLVTG